MQQPQFEFYGGSYKHRRKGHDRVYVDPERRAIAAIDGSHTARLSRPVRRFLPQILDAYDDVRKSSTENAVRGVVHQLDNLKSWPFFPEPHATLSLVCFDLRPQGIEIAHAVVGDASAHIDYRVFPSENDPQRLIIHNPTKFWPQGNRRHVDTTQFLGRHRTMQQIRTQELVGSLVVPYSAAWLAVVASDGAPPVMIEGIMDQAQTIAEVGPTIMEQAPRRDDIAVAVVGLAGENVSHQIAITPQYSRPIGQAALST
ncbi:MAG TPA: hypothetical protein VHB51_02440 [Candidatus Saccharimonadales bacterium]|nr:hypothetical protein [Candidatus Saccharimonadales bacterium]